MLQHKSQNAEYKKFLPSPQEVAWANQMIRAPEVHIVGLDDDTISQPNIKRQQQQSELMLRERLMKEFSAGPLGQCFQNQHQQTVVEAVTAEVRIICRRCVNQAVVSHTDSELGLCDVCRLQPDVVNSEAYPASIVMIDFKNFPSGKVQTCDEFSASSDNDGPVIGVGTVTTTYIDTYTPPLFLEQDEKSIRSGIEELYSEPMAAEDKKENRDTYAAALDAQHRAISVQSLRGKTPSQVDVTLDTWTLVMRETYPKILKQKIAQRIFEQTVAMLHYRTSASEVILDEPKKAPVVASDVAASKKEHKSFIRREVDERAEKLQSETGRPVLAKSERCFGRKSWKKFGHERKV